MKLYIYDHCPFCTKSRMVFGLKGLGVDVSVIAEDDIDTPTRLIGKKSLPILQKADGSHMPESMEIVHYVDALSGSPVAHSGGDRAIRTWVDEAWPVILPLAIPRMARADLPEFANASAREAFIARQTGRLGDFDTLLGQSAALIAMGEAHLAKLVPLLEGRDVVDADDFLMYPSLRMLSIVKGLTWPSEVQSYMIRLAALSRVPLHTDQAL